MCIRDSSWAVPEIFRRIQKKGNIDDKEMFRTLNMGIGMVLVLTKKDIDRAIAALKKSGVNAHVIGKVIKGDRGVIIKA